MSRFSCASRAGSFSPRMGSASKASTAILPAPVKAIGKSELSGAFDVILLTCKAYDLADAIEAIAPAVGRGSAILPLLNGVAHIDLLNTTYGRDFVLGGTAKIAATLLPDGTVKHLNDWNFITFGEQDGAMSERVRSLKAAFDKTPVVAAAVPDIMHMMWENSCTSRRSPA